MADILRLGYGSGLTANKINLLTGTLRIARGGYTPKTGPKSAQWVQDVLYLQADDTPANIYDAVEEIDDRLHLADLWFKDPSQEAAVWLEYGSDGETLTATYDFPKRAMIKGGSLSINMPDKFLGGFVDHSLFATLTLTRSRWFENPVRETWGQAFSPLWGYEWDITTLAQYAGNHPARLELVEVYGFTGNTDKLWVGIRSLHEGISGFDSIWELEDGTAGTDTSFGAVSGASGSDAATCTFATSTDLEERVSIEISDVVISNYDHYVGRYLILLRCKVGASTTCGIKMSYGTRDSVVVPAEEVYIDNTDWMLIELGEVRIPPDGHRLAFGSSGLSAFTISIEAERISGSGSLILDALSLVPSEHLFKASDCYGSVIPRAQGWVLPDGSQSARIVDTGSLYRIQPPFNMSDWALPTDPGVVVAHAQTDTAHSLTEGASVVLYYIPRWNLFRSR